MKRLLALSLLLAACAASRQPAPDERQQLEAARLQLAREEAELMGERAEARPLDCARARQLGDNICGLAERICALVARLPPDPGHANDCGDARTRCKAARERVKARCPG
jgi:hypothetical protein